MSHAAANSPPYEIKSADLPLLAFQLKSSDLLAVQAALNDQLKDSPGFFDQDPVLIDTDGLPESSSTVDWIALVQLLQGHGLRPVAVKSGRSDWVARAMEAGLLPADDARIRRQPPAVSVTPEPPAAPPAAPALCEALVLDKPLRSGQQFYAKGRDLIVLAMVNPGAEVLADGHIHVYAPLRGKAIAGARGFTGARIFAQSMEPELISIAGVYRTSEHPLPPEVHAHAAQVFLSSGADGDKLVIKPLRT